MNTENHMEIDARGLLCPLPVLRARKVLIGLRPGMRVLLRATDAASWLDVPHFCAQSGHLLIAASEEDGERRYVIERGPDRPEEV
jgi:tRNA 2-thiouridine synthesizing protein A